MKAFRRYTALYLDQILEASQYEIDKKLIIEAEIRVEAFPKEILMRKQMFKILCRKCRNIDAKW